MSSYLHNGVHFSRDHSGFVHIFTDGACSNNGRNGAIAGIGVFIDGEAINRGLNYLIAIFTTEQRSNMHYYAVAKGWNVGIYTSWDQCQPMVNHYSGALYKKFSNRSSAWNFLDEHLPQRELNKITERERLFTRGTDDYIRIYTDGACRRNGRKGAQAAIGVFIADNHPNNVSRVAEHRRTNIGAEMEAVLEAVSIIGSYQLDHVIIYTDCQFIVKGMNNWIWGWMRRGWQNTNDQPVAYKNEFQYLNAKRRRWCIQFEHVRGHSGIYGNEQADRLAKNALP